MITKRAAAAAAAQEDEEELRKNSGVQKYHGQRRRFRGL